jgi:hypothetical protein
MLHNVIVYLAKKLCNLPGVERMLRFFGLLGSTGVHSLGKVWVDKISSLDHVWGLALFSRIFVFWPLKVVETNPRALNDQIYIRLPKQHVA